MKLLKLTAAKYRSIRDVAIELNDLNLFIGANASGKSTILDALRFLHEGVQSRDFRSPVYSRGGLFNLAWKGSPLDDIKLTVDLDDEGTRFEWTIIISEVRHEIQVEEHIRRFPGNSPPQELLSANKGEGWWWSGEEKAEVTLKQSSSVCALAAASADASFPARSVAEFVGKWGFFDPSPFLLRRDWTGGSDSAFFDPYGRNLAETLYALNATSPEVLERIVTATREVVGLPKSITPRQSEDRFYFVQEEPGLQFPVNQMGVSSGTLRMLALMTAIYGNQNIDLVGIEEPENYIHPAALSSFVVHLLDAMGRIQFLVTTHSPLLLDFLNDPAAVRIVRRDEQAGTSVLNERDPVGVRKALDESDFGLGEYYETQGFGG